MRNEADSQAAGDFIMEQVRRFTADDQPPLHASRAGGRKTMGYLLGAAMILFGRPGDRLSHVLVQPSELESSDFFFPPPKGASIPVVGAMGRTKVKRSEVRIDLVELPFPRLRLFQDEPDLQPKQFSELVQRLETRLNAALEPRLEIDWKRRSVRCAGVGVHLPPLQLGIYGLLAERRLAHGPQANCGGCEDCFLPATEVADQFAKRLREVMEVYESHAVLLGKWKVANFNAEVSHIAKKLSAALGKAGRRYEICRLHFEGQQLFGIALPPSAIRLLGKPEKQRKTDAG